MMDLRERVPGQALIEQLLREWDGGRIRVEEQVGIVIDDEALGWYRGVFGERTVAAHLARLGPEYTVLHSVPIGRGSSDIDHVVIGPSGVFTINAKYHPGRKIWSAGYGIYVGNREEKHYIRNLEFEARRAATRLSAACRTPVAVTGVLVFVEPTHVQRKSPAGSGAIDLRVVSDAELVACIAGNRVLADEQLEHVVRAAQDPRTWHARPAENTLPPAALEQEFIALAEALSEVDPATHAPASAPARRRAATAPGRPAQGPRRARQRRAGRTRERVILGVLGIATMILLTRPEIQAIFTRFVTGVLLP